jgi:hypothetical protein
VAHLVLRSDQLSPVELADEVLAATSGREPRAL